MMATALLLKGLTILLLNLIARSLGEEETVTLEYDDPAGDLIGPYGNDRVSGPIQLRTSFPFFGRRESVIFINENGIVSFRKPVKEPYARPLPFSTDPSSFTPAFIAGYWADMNTAANGGAIFYRQMDATDVRFCKDKAYVLQLIRETFGGSASGFDPTYILIVTWDGVHGFQTGKNAVTFQIVLATDSKQSYVLLLYSDVRWDVSNRRKALVGFNSGDGEKSFTHPLSVADKLLDLDLETNGRRIGAFVYRVDQTEIVEPSPGQNKELICNLTCEQVSGSGCKCPSDRVLADNGVNCVFPPVAVHFINNTPAVTENGVKAILKANRPDAVLECQIMRVDSQGQNCTSGVYEHNGLSAKSYALRVVATVPNTRERVILRGVFRVPDKEMCSVTIVNRVEVKRDKAKVDFVGSDSVKEFFCRVDRTKRVECESPFIAENLSRGNHRVIVIPRGCGRKRKAASIRFFIS